MFDQVFYTQTVRRGPLYFPSLVSILLHTAALFLLITHPELVFSGKLVPIKKEPVPPLPAKTYTILTMLGDPNEPFVAPTHIPQTNIHSDRTRVAQSEPEELEAPDKKAPYSTGEAALPLQVGRSNKKSSKPGAQTAERKDLAKVSGEDLKKKGQAAKSGEGSGEGAGDKNGPGKVLDFTKLVLPKQIPPSLPEPIVPILKPAEPKAGKGAEGKDAKTTDGGKLTLDRGTSTGGPDPKLTANINSSFKSSVGGNFETVEFSLDDKYAREVDQRLRRNLVIPSNLATLKGRRATVFFQIGRDGRISNLKIEAGSGDYKFDIMALNSVYNSNPFPPLPKGYPNDHVGVRYSFYKQD